MIYKLFSIILIILLPIGLFAQEESLDYIYTKSGSLFKGKIVEYTQGDALRLEISSGNIIVVDDRDIKKIIQGGNLHKGKIRAAKTYDFKERGMYYFASGQINAGGSAFESEGTAGLGLQGVVGYQWNRWLGTGVGIGIDYYYPGSGENIMPIYGEVRSYLMDKRVAPYVSVQSGYGFTFVDEDRGMQSAEGGFMAHPAIGLRCGASGNANFTIDVGMKIQKATYRFNRRELLEHQMTYRRLVLRVGVLF